MKHLRGYLLLLGLGLTAFGHSQVAVRLRNRAKLFAKPTERSLVLIEVSARGNFRALEQSPDKQWVFISDGLRYGWIRKAFVEATDDSADALAPIAIPPPAMTRESVAAEDAPPAAESEGSSSKKNADSLDDDAPATEDGADELGPPEPSVFSVTMAGSFYEQPKGNSTRFGRLEENDQVELLETSSDSKWVKVRLEETGEEGWLPKARVTKKSSGMKSSRMATQNAALTWHLGLYGSYLPAPWGPGIMATVRRGFSSLAVMNTPFEFGAGIGYEVGSKTVYQGANISATYLDLRALVHWEPAVTENISIPFEVAVLVKSGTITTTLPQSVFEASKSRIKAQEVGFAISAGGTYRFTEFLQLDLRPELQLTSSLDIGMKAGLVYSF